MRNVARVLRPQGPRLVAALLAAVGAAALLGAGEPTGADARARAAFILACAETNDVFRAMCSGGRAPARYDTAAEAVRRAPPGAALLVLADGYPAAPTSIPAGLLDEAAAKNARLFIEYPAALDGLEIGAPRPAEWERAVAASDFFGEGLARLRILAIHGCRFVPVRAEAAHLVAARVAGYDTAFFGLPAETWPLLFEHPARPGVLVAATKLSQFVTARYAPAYAWRILWSRILAWLAPGMPVPELAWTPSVRPSYGPREPLPADAEARALRRGIEWYFAAKMLVHPSWSKTYDEDATAWPDRVGPLPRSDWPCGDGSLGVLEGFASRIEHTGAQAVRWWRRHDCNGESAGAMALAASALGDDKYKAVAANIVDWLYFRSIMALGTRADPAHPSFGLMGWNDVPRYWRDLDGYGVYYADDNARGVLGVLAAAAVLKTDRWDERAMRCLVANLRLTGPHGFTPDRIDTAPLERNGWRHYFQAPTISYDMNYQAYPWACLLWAYRHTGCRQFLDRAETALRMTIEAYPDAWRWSGSMQVERARILLPLAWLVRVDDTPEHRAWLARLAGDLLALQDACGAIREALGPAGHGVHTPPRSNAEYGTAEAALIQSDGDPAADLLYTLNFAFLGLHEAYAATRERRFREAEDKLAAFLCRAQVRAPDHAELDGAWFRAFDFRAWDYWASNADAGWGAWSIETGWKQAWILAVLALRHTQTSLWDVTGKSAIGERFEKVQREMLGDEPRRP